MSTVITWSAELFEWKPYDSSKTSENDSSSSDSSSDLHDLFDPPVNANSREELEKIHQSNQEALNEDEDKGIIENTKDFMDFIGDVKEDGLVYAIWGKSFPELLGDFIKECFRVVGQFVTGNGDLFFLLPALAFVTSTFVFGRNRFSKWILPLLFAYVISRGIYKLLS